jgi:GNAT superfamily N-acetyltransferase
MTHPLDTPVWTALGTLHRDLALTSGGLARYPGAIAPFRYFGLHADDGRLAAMVGERMGGAGFREVSAVCTHPDFAGRGLARRLLRQGLVPFLHVSPENGRAERLYLEGGYRLRAEVAFWSLRRRGA